MVKKMTHSRSELFFAVRLRLLAKYSGQFCLVIAALNLAPLAVALLAAETSIAFNYAGLIAGLTGVGILLARIRHQGQMQMNEAMVLVALVFLAVPLTMTIPLVCEGSTFIDAFFETVSATTTTGLSTMGSIELRPRTFQFARAWMQWYGGLGIVVFSLALVVRPGMSALRLAKLDKPDDLVGGTRAHAQRILLVYSGITLSGILIWVLFGGNPLQGVLYIFSAVSTGGFAPTSGSLADLDRTPLAWVVTLISIAGAIPLALYHQSWRSGWRGFMRNIEMRGFLVAGLLVSLLFGLNLMARGMGLNEAILHGPLMAFSAQSTSGFSSLSVSSLDAGSKIILILAMATGGSVGSTAGGFKLIRLLILFGLLFRCLERLSASPHAVTEQRLDKRRIEAAEVQDALMIILLFVGVVIVSWIPFLFYGYAPLDSLFEVISATGTVGLSSGITDVGLPTLLKSVLCADMLLGRLEFVAWMVFFYHRTWFGRKREDV